MMNKRRAAEFGLAKALVLALSVATVARAGLSYLPLAGPPPLRLMAVRHPQAVAILKIEAAAVKPPAETNAAVKFSKETNAVVNAAGDGSIPFIGTLPPVSIGAGNPLDNDFGTQIFTLPTPDMMGITPQMLATYFKPVADGTNAGALFVPLHIGFIPPVMPPEKSSHAEYIVK